jgi:hypothetical protein
MEMAEKLTPSITTFVREEELLYRATESSEIWQEEDLVRVGPEAFRDPLNRPSVDRAEMRGFNPDLTRDYVCQDKSRPDCGIVALYSKQVRQISPLEQLDAKGQPVSGPQINVEHVPLPAEDTRPANDSHAEIFGSPHISAKNLFRRLKVRLAQEAEKNQDQILFPRNAEERSPKP